MTRPEQQSSSHPATADARRRAHLPRAGRRLGHDADSNPACFVPALEAPGKYVKVV